MSIKPALTASEWADGYVGREGFGVQVDEGDHLCGEFSIIYDDMACAPAHLIRHGIAALALHGQPFGFTWADVRRCRDIAHGLEVHYAAGRGLDAAGTGATIEGWRSLADRIESLLPPREK